MKKLVMVFFLVVLYPILLSAQTDSSYMYKQVFIKLDNSTLKTHLYNGTEVNQIEPLLWVRKENQKTLVYVVEDNADGTINKIVDRPTKYTTYFTSAMHALSSYTDEGWVVISMSIVDMSNHAQTYLYLLKKKK